MVTPMSSNGPSGNGGDLPFAQTLFDACDQLRGSVESAEYKHLVLGLVFLKYISDSFERRRAKIAAELADPESEIYTEDEGERAIWLDDRDEYDAVNVFWVPEEARWGSAGSTTGILAEATQPDIGVKLDEALAAIERENEGLRGVLPRIYARAPIAPATLTALIGVISKVGFGDDEDEARDLLGRVYEYFIKTFARSEGHRGGEFYTPASVVELLVEMLEPYEGRVFDPACGSGGLFVQSAKFVQAHGGQTQKLSIYGQEMNQATWRIAKMNMAIHGISGDIRLGNSLLDDQHKDLRADYVIANPPFNIKKWGVDQTAGDSRWAYGMPPDGNANFAWIQHFLAHLAPDGRAGFVLANGSLTSMTSGEGAIREALVRADVIDCVVALPSQLFFTTGIPVSLWFLDRDKASSSERNRCGEVLFLDARSLGAKVSRTQIELSGDEVARLVSTYHVWRGTAGATYADEVGFAFSATLDDIERAGFILSPGRFVGAIADAEDDAVFVERLTSAAAVVREELQRSADLRDEINRQLGRLGLDS